MKVSTKQLCPSYCCRNVKGGYFSAQSGETSLKETALYFRWGNTKICSLGRFLFLLGPLQRSLSFYPALDRKNWPQDRVCLPGTECTHSKRKSNEYNLWQRFTQYFHYICMLNSENWAKRMLRLKIQALSLGHFTT